MTNMACLIERESLEENSIINTERVTSLPFSAIMENFKMKLLNINDLSAFLNVKKSTIYDWTHRDVIPYVKLGSLLRFKFDEIESWLKKNSHHSQNRP